MMDIKMGFSFGSSSFGSSYCIFFFFFFFIVFVFSFLHLLVGGNGR